LVDIETVFREILTAPFRSCEWQVICAHPGMYSDEGLVFLEEKRNEARVLKDHPGVSEISSYINLFKRCREIGAEKAYFGAKLNRECREAFGCVSPSKAVEAGREARRRFRLRKWDESVEILESALSDRETKNFWLLRTEISHLLGHFLLSSQKGSRKDNIERVIEISPIAGPAFSITWRSFITIDQGGISLRTSRRP